MRGPNNKQWSRCPMCDGFAEVKDSRVERNGWRNRRRRCATCNYTWHTYEVPAEMMRNIKAFIVATQQMKLHKDRLDLMTKGLDFTDDKEDT